MEKNTDKQGEEKAHDLVIGYRTGKDSNTDVCRTQQN